MSSGDSMDGTNLTDRRDSGNPRAPYRGDLPAAAINPLEPLVGGPTLREDRAFQFLKVLVDRAKSPVAKPGHTPGESVQRWVDGLARTSVLLADSLDAHLAVPAIRADLVDSFDALEGERDNA